MFEKNVSLSLSQHLFPLAAFLLPQGMFSRSNVIAMTNCCTVQGTFSALQRRSNLVRNERTIFCWDHRDCKMTHIIVVSTSRLRKFPFYYCCFQSLQQQTLNIMPDFRTVQPDASPSIIQSSQNSFLALTGKSNIWCLGWSIQYCCIVAPGKLSVVVLPTAKYVGSWIFSNLCNA